ncbi:MAG TPA: triose-phosphate isomerase [Candidatus Nitrosotalea sp.]|nr:triose-phosphate isomerase [Candidatus Nitrosotalea sp.]
MSRALLAANWKLNPTSAGAALDLVRGVEAAARERQDQVQVAVFPPFPWLLGVSELLADGPIELGAQDCYWEASGAFTGEVSAAMLKDWCPWVIVGHSERRRLFLETDEMVARKTGAALACQLTTIVCVGESESELAAGEAEAVVSRQVRAALAEVAADDSPRLLFAYEPLWAIGTGRNAEPEHAYRMMRLVRNHASELLGAGAAARLRVLYGGSVSRATVGSYVELPWCDGCLVGSASLNAGEFSAMIEIVAEVYGAGRGT